MTIRNTLTAGVAAAVLATAAGAAFAQTAQDAGTTMYPGQHHNAHHATAGIKGSYHPLTVSPAPVPVAAPAPVNPITGVGDALATPFNTLGAPGQIVGGSIAGASSIAAAPFNGLFGTAPGISANPAPPLPIKARFVGTGAVTATFDEGFSQDVPVDKSGPIYMIDNTGHDRTVTPFSLLAFPVTAATYTLTQPLRPVAPHS